MKIYSYQLGKMSRGSMGNVLLGGTSRAVADAFKSEAKVAAGEKIELEFRSLDNPLAVDSLFIEPRAGETVTIWVVNLSDPDGAHVHGHCSRPRLDSHFEVYYDLVGIEPTGRTPDGDEVRVPSRSIFSISASEIAESQVAEFQDACPLLSWGAPPGKGPVDGDKKVCATFRGAANPLAGPLE